MRFLSTEWIAALDEAARSHPPVAVHTTLVIGQVVTDAPGGEVSWNISMSPTGLRVRAGIDDATVVLTSDVATATAIARAEQSPQEAFIAGTLHLSGDTAALVDHAAALAGLPDVFAAVRHATEWPPGHPSSPDGEA